MNIQYNNEFGMNIHHIYPVSQFYSLYSDIKSIFSKSIHFKYNFNVTCAGDSYYMRTRWLLRAHAHMAELDTRFSIGPRI